MSEKGFSQAVSPVCGRFCPNEGIVASYGN
ncbi:DUF6783 domain-containing protein [Fusicatenibacter sp.]